MISDYKSKIGSPNDEQSPDSNKTLYAKLNHILVELGFVEK